MKPQSWARDGVLVALGAAIVSVWPAPPAARSEDGSIVTVVGCVTAGVEAGCRVLTTADGTAYSLHTPAETDEKRAYRVRGETGGMDTCMQGLVLQAKARDVTRLDKECPLKKSSP